MKGRMAFWVIGFGLFGLGMASSLLYVAWQIKTGHGGDTYYNHRLQPITHWGYVGTLAIALVAVIVGLVYRGREMLERHKHAKRTAEQSIAADRADERRDGRTAVLGVMGSALKVFPDRYAVPNASNSFSLEGAQLENGIVTVQFQLNSDHEIDVLLDAPAGIPSEEISDLARTVLINLATLDLIVQKSCADDCARSKLDSDHFESWLAYISIARDSIKLHYWGGVVNTEWDEVFSLKDGGWIHTASGLGPGTGVIVTLSQIAAK